MSVRDLLVEKLETELKARLNNVLNALYEDLPEKMSMEDSMRCHIVLISGLLGMMEVRMGSMPSVPENSPVNTLFQLLQGLLIATKSKLVNLEFEKLTRSTSERN